MGSSIRQEEKDWGQVEKESLCRLKKKMTQAPVLAHCSTEKQTIPSADGYRMDWERSKTIESLSSDPRQPEVRHFKICKCLDATKFVVLSDLNLIETSSPKNVFKVAAQECKKSTFGRRASLKNVAA